VTGAEQLPGWQREHLAVLLDAVGDVQLTGDELRALRWLAGKDTPEVELLAAVIQRAREEGGAVPPPGVTEACPDCGRVGYAVPLPGVPGEVECAVCSASWTPDTRYEPSTHGVPTWVRGDPDPRWSAGEWAVRFHPNREPQARTVALEYGGDHLGWLTPGEARALAAALLAAAAWSPGGVS